MNNPTKRSIAVLIVAGFAVAAAVSVRLRYNFLYKQSQQAYKVYQERSAVQQQVEAEARANESKIAQLKAAVAKNPKDVRARWKLADELQKFRMLPEALEDVQAIARLDPASQDAAIAVANTELALGRLADSVPTYREITRRWPKNVEGWQGLAASLYQLRRYRDAGEAGRQALILDPDDKGSRIIVASSALEYGLEFPDENETRAPLRIARALYTDLAKADPDDGQTQYQLGLSIFLLHDKAGGLPYLKKAAELLPDRVNVAVDYAQILITNGKNADARAFLSQAIARNPKVPSYYFLLCESYQYESDPKLIQESIAAGKKAVELAPNVPTYWDRLGAQYLKAQDVQNARLAFEKSLVLDANRSYPYQQLAGIYTRLGDAKRASIAAKMATRMVANDETMRHLEALSQQYPGAVNLILIRADRYHDLKRYGPARDLYEQALKLDPSNAAARRGIEAIDRVRMPGGAPK
jgi:tetratricopeptide (TPR) repeat protein